MIAWLPERLYAKVAALPDVCQHLDSLSCQHQETLDFVERMVLNANADKCQAYLDFEKDLAIHLDRDERRIYDIVHGKYSVNELTEMGTNTMEDYLSRCYAIYMLINELPVDTPQETYRKKFLLPAIKLYTQQPENTDARIVVKLFQYVLEERAIELCQFGKIPSLQEVETWFKFARYSHREYTEIALKRFPTIAPAYIENIFGHKLMTEYRHLTEMVVGNIFRMGGHVKQQRELLLGFKAIIDTELANAPSWKYAGMSYCEVDISFRFLHGLIDVEAIDEAKELLDMMMQDALGRFSIYREAASDALYHHNLSMDTDLLGVLRRVFFLAAQYPDFGQGEVVQTIVSNMSEGEQHAFFGGVNDLVPLLVQRQAMSATAFDRLAKQEADWQAAMEGRFNHQVPIAEA